MKDAKPANKIPLAEKNVAPCHYPGLTGLRGLAALWVFALHAYTSAGVPDTVPDPLSWLFLMGWTGVDLFFALSAFLLSLPWANALRQQTATPSVATYMQRRIARIFPAYYLQCLVLGALAASGLAAEVFWYTPTWQTWLAHALLWLNAWPTVPALVSVWWTLPVEFGFYLLLPLLAKSLTDRRWYWLLVLIVLSLVYRYCILSAGLDRAQSIYWADHLPGRLFQFLIGMLAAFFWVKWRLRFSTTSTATRSIVLLATGVALITLPAIAGEGFSFGNTFETHGFQAYYHLLASLIIAVMLLAIASGKTYFDSLLSAWPLQLLGKISFGLYLWHYPVMLVLREKMGGNQQAGQNFLSYFFACLAVSLTLAFLSWYWVEAPILKRVSAKKLVQNA
jgi:peptidoglycan/LPS O-acetylase OafA/YrhL